MADIDGKVKLEVTFTQVGYLTAALAYIAHDMVGPEAELMLREVNALRCDIYEQTLEQIPEEERPEPKSEPQASSEDSVH